MKNNDEGLLAHMIKEGEVEAILAHRLEREEKKLAHTRAAKRSRDKKKLEYNDLKVKHEEVTLKCARLQGEMNLMKDRSRFLAPGFFF